MPNENVLRAVLTLFLCALLPAALYFRVKSMATGERLNRFEEGVWILFPLRLCGLLFMTGLFLFLAQPEWLTWAQWNLPEWLRWSGVMIAGAALGLVVWVFRTLGPNLTDTVV